jgi:aryl-alcohol dehydrogenase-like predicted oxidoreductase
MNRRTLPGSNLRVSEVCLGTMTWGEQNTEAEAHQQLTAAFDEFGLNFMDAAGRYRKAMAPMLAGGALLQDGDQALHQFTTTSLCAEMYPIPPKAETQGRTEQYIGSWLKCGVVKREDVVLATKVSGYGRQPWMRPERMGMPRVNAEHIEYAVDNSLKVGRDADTKRAHALKRG